MKWNDKMKNPNGYGTVVKLSGNRRNPFAVRKTTGWNDKGHPIYLAIGYAPTREDGMMMLAEYNRNPYDIDLSKITMSEVYDKWSARNFPKMSSASVSAMKAGYKKTSSLHKMKYKEIKAYHMQDAIDESGGYSTQGSVKNLFGHLDKFALELDIIMKPNSALVSSAPIPDTKKIPFTDDEVTAVWKIQEKNWVDSILVFLYTGFRISELLDIKTANVDLEAMTIKGGTKTRAGKDRIVPIHSKILKLIEVKMKEGNEYLFPYNNKKCSKVQYYIIWNIIMDELELNHTPHECRHTFRSRLDSAGANKVCIDLMMGHKSAGTGERIYTHKTIEELKIAIELITS
ncbi:MAG: tyrosine-type recombinase/integrase [Oscillospiraceae bacterium]